MPRKIISEEDITVAETKELLERYFRKTREVGEFQRRTRDYATKFAKIDAELAKDATRRLVTQFKIDRSEAVQIVNCMPKSVEELRGILAVKGRIIETEKLEGILNVLNEFRKKEKINSLKQK